MKKSTFLLFSLFFALAAFSQNNHQYDQFMFDGMPDDGYFDPYQNPSQRHGALKNATKEMDNVVSRPDSTVKYKFDAFGDSIPDVKTVFEYDAFGNETSNTYYEWDETEKNWIGDYQYLFTYNNSNAPITIKYLVWEDNNWELSYIYKSEYIEDKISRTLLKRIDSNNDTIFEESVLTYDSNPTKVETHQYEWTSLSSPKILSYKEIIYYNEHGNDSVYYYESFEEGVFVYGIIYEYFYENEKIVYSISSKWDSNKNDYIYNRKTEYDFKNVDTEKEIRSIYTWNTEREEWEFSSTEETEYNTNGKEILTAILKYNNYPKLTDLSSKTEKQYNSFNDLTYYVNYRWDTLALDWTPRDKVVYTRNNDGIIYSRSQIFWNKNTMDWGFRYDAEYYYYNGGLLTVNSLSIKKISFYPNPATNYISIVNPFPGKSIDVELLSLSGQQVARTCTNNKLSQIYLEKLTPGIYFLQVKYDGNNEIHKVIKN